MFKNNLSQKISEENIRKAKLEEENANKLSSSSFSNIQSTNKGKKSIFFTILHQTRITL